MKLSAPLAIYEYTDGGKKVRYVHTVKPEKAMLNPLVILADHFYPTELYYEHFQGIAKDRPFYIVELPGMGLNEDRPNKVIDQDINLLNRWATSLGFEKISLVASSYTCLWAIDYALGYPDQVESLVLYGATSRIRPATRKLLTYQLEQLRLDNIKDFAVSMAHATTNYEKLYDHEKLKHHVDKNCEQAVINKHHLEIYLQKILAWEDVFRGTSENIDLLLVAGEFDQLSGSYESFLLGKKCVDRTLAIMSEVDHHCIWDRPDIAARLCRRFLNNQPLSRMKDIKLNQRTDYPLEKIRQRDRYLMDRKGLMNLEIGLNVPVQIKEMSTAGFRFTCKEVEQKFIALKYGAVAHIPEEDILVKVAIVPIPDQRGEYIAHFNPQDFKHLDQINDFIARTALTEAPVWKAV